MNVHRIYYPVLALGPGRRIGLWTRGCSRRCEGCMSPELWVPDPKREIGLPVLEEILTRLLAERPVDGVTVSGGEPLDQEPELTALLDFLRRSGVEDILLYTGYTSAELGGRALQLTRYATLVCGPYNKEENDGRALRGSSNQEILFASDSMRRRYAAVLDGPRLVQPVMGQREVFLIGIQSPGADRPAGDGHNGRCRNAEHPGNGEQSPGAG